MKSIWKSPTLVALVLAILVPMIGHSVTHAAQHEQATTAAIDSKTGAKHARHTSSHHMAAQMPKLDLNKASRAELESLPGINAATAAHIIESRPYKSRRELLERKVLIREAYRRIRNLVTVAPAPKNSKKHEPAPAQSGTDEEEPSGGGTR